jgi:hypothetical protein
MDVAALVISILAVLLSVIVAGWAIYLQWCMFKATTDQLNLIGRESARLGESLSRLLGQIHEATTTTRGSIESTFLPLVSLLKGVHEERPGASGKALAGAAEEVRRESDAWRVERAVATLSPIVAAPAVLQYLSAGPRQVATLAGELFNLMPDGGNKENWRSDVMGVLAALMALEFLVGGPEGETVSLAPAARQIAPRLAEAKGD